MRLPRADPRPGGRQGPPGAGPTAVDRDVERLIPRTDPVRRTRLLGILNLTPDSFHDGGIDRSLEASVARAAGLVEEGADALDLGAESSRPGAEAVPEEEERRRLLPVLERVVELGVPVSVDTVKASVAAAALRRGATIVNDISGMTRDPRMAEVCAEAGCAVVLMHMRGRPRDMQTFTDYADVVGETRSALEERLEAVIQAGVPEERIILDPGIGFAKTPEQNLQILARLSEYASLGRPLLVGASRKSFLSRYSGSKRTEDRLEATLATSALAVLGGASILRVHDVGANRKAVLATEAILDARDDGRPVTER